MTVVVLLSGHGCSWLLQGGHTSSVNGALLEQLCFDLGVVCPESCSKYVAKKIMDWALSEDGCGLSVHFGVRDPGDNPLLWLRALVPWCRWLRLLLCHSVLFGRCVTSCALDSWSCSSTLGQLRRWTSVVCLGKLGDRALPCYHLRLLIGPDQRERWDSQHCCLGAEAAFSDIHLCRAAFSYWDKVWTSVMWNRPKCHTSRGSDSILCERDLDV